MRRAFAAVVMPGTLAVAIGAALLAMARGVAPTVVVPVVFVAAMAWVAWLERALPYRREWNRAQGDLLADALYLPTTSAVVALMRPAIATLGVAVGATTMPGSFGSSSMKAL